MHYLITDHDWQHSIQHFRGTKFELKVVLLSLISIFYTTIANKLHVTSHRHFIVMNSKGYLSKIQIKGEKNKTYYIYIFLSFSLSL